MSFITGLIIWLALVAALVVVFPVLAGNVYFNQVVGFESRRKCIRIGMLSIVLCGASFFFLPLIVMNLDLSNLQKSIRDILTASLASVQDSLPVEPQTGLADPGLLASLARQSGILIAPAAEYAITIVQRTTIIAACVGTFVTAVLVFLLIILTREDKTRAVEQYTRKHLFEYKPAVFEQLNKDFIGR